MNEETRAHLIWCTLLHEIKNPYGVAGIMGNLYAESRLNPSSVSGFAGGTSREQYIQNVNNGSIDSDTFAHDGHAFGLAQWRYWSRKKALYDFIRRNPKEECFDITDITMQVYYLLEEIQKYKDVWNVVQNATSVKEVSDIVLEKYERPATINDFVKKKRADFGQKYFDKYTMKKQKYIVTTAPRVNVRFGNGKEYKIIDQLKDEGSRLPYIASSENGWYAGQYSGIIGGKSLNLAVWISGEFSKIMEE